MSLAFDPAASIAVRAALALLLSFAAAHKLRDLAAFRDALRGYELLPVSAVTSVAVLIPVSEAALAASLALLGRGGIAVAALLAVYSAAIALNLRRGRRGIDCGCSGPAGRVPLRPALLTRNALLIALALVATLPAAARPLVWIDAITVPAAVACAALLYGAVETAFANSSWDERRSPSMSAVPRLGEAR